MQCSYHPSNAARSRCASCARPLCAACDHRIKGYPYCQDCIVSGIEYLSRSYRSESRPKSKAWLAALCGVFPPGFGAVYNRQNIKAFFHFMAIVGLFQLSSFLPFRGLLRLAGVSFYLYSIIDAYRTAQQIAQGESAERLEERFKQAIVRRAPAIGLMLIAAGLLAVLQIARPFSISIVRLLPVALIFLGGYLLTRYFRRSRYEPHQPAPPYPLIPGRFDKTHDEAQSARHDYR
jgi:TM2 domain-containing membrane protein YozV